MAAKLKAPVGLAPRKGEGDPVRNNPDDVELVRKALVANGYKALAINGKVDGGLLKAIAALQKKAGFKNPDQVIDPDGRTWKALAPALEKALAEEAKAAKIPMRRIKWKGKEYLLLEKDYQAMRLDIFKRLDRYMKSLISNNKLNQKIFNEYIETAQIKRGLMNAITDAIIMSWSDVKFPSGSLAGGAAGATTRLERAIAGKDLKMLATALPEAERAINAFSADVQRFLKEFTGAAGSVAMVLSVTSAVAFGIVGVMAVPALLTVTTMTAAQAAVVSGAGVAMVQSTSQELGKHAAGQKVTAFESVKNIALDGAVGVLTAGLGNKIPVKWADDLGAALAPKVAQKVPWLTKEAAETFLKGYLLKGGAEGVKTAYGEGVKIIGEVAKTGKKPTAKQFQDAAVSTLFTVVSAGLLGKLGGFQKKWSYRNRQVLNGTIFPDRLAKLAKGNEIPSVIKAKMYADVMSKVEEEVAKTGFTQGIEAAGKAGSDDKKKMMNAAEKAITSDRRIQKLIDNELQKAMKKYKVGAK